MVRGHANEQAGDTPPEIDTRDAPALALLGHDLRAALSELIGGLRLIDVTTLLPAPRNQIRRSRAASEALALLLEQALGLLQGEDTALDTPIRTDRCLNDIRLRWEGGAQVCGMQFTLRVAPGVPDFLTLDPALIERLLSNLLGNALKYSHGRKVARDFSLAAANWLQIRASDDGQGFADAVLPRLFIAPVQSDTHIKPGTGLGLHIVRDMVLRAGGTIVAGNLLPSGAEVVAQLPLPNRHDAQYDNWETGTLPDLGCARILVADDNKTSRDVLTQMLSRMGAEVVTVADGTAAIGRIERESFDALLVDIEMPRFSGLDVIRHLRSAPGPMARLPILAVTAYSLRANRQAIEAAGATAVLSKPNLAIAALGDTILAAIDPDRESRPSVPRDVLRLEPEAGRFAHLLEIAGPATAAELVARLSEDLRSVERGLLSAARGPHWPGIRAQSHVLIALAGTTGAIRLQHLCEDLNELANRSLPDRGTFLILLPQTLEALDALIHFVEHQSPLTGMPS